MPPLYFIRSFYGKSSMSLINSVINHFVLTPEEQSSPQLERYYLLRWKRDYYQSQLKNQGLELEHQGITYLSLPSIEVINNRPEDLALSFRKLSYIPYGYVLVQPWKEKE